MVLLSRLGDMLSDYQHLFKYKTGHTLYTQGYLVFNIFHVFSY